MPFALAPAAAAAIHQMVGDSPPPKLPVGDIEGRRESTAKFFELLASLNTTPPDVATQDFYTKAEDGHSLLLRWFTKKDVPQPGSAVVYAHGGGMITMGIDGYDQIIKNYVSRSGVPFLAVEYRLAPEVRAPVPVTDVYAGLKYLKQNAASLGVNPARIGIMGDSAGGGITASLAHYIKLKGGPSVAKQLLIYPMLDDRTTEPNPEIPFPIWSTDDNITGWTALLGEKRGTAEVDVLGAAGRATVQDARGLPPAYIDCGQIDIFVDETLEYVRTLSKAGVPVDFHLLSGCPHGFEALAPESWAPTFAREQRDRALKSL